MDVAFGGHSLVMLSAGQLLTVASSFEHSFQVIAIALDDPFGEVLLQPICIHSIVVTHSHSPLTDTVGDDPIDFK